MFMGPLESEKQWNTDSMNGAKKFLDRVFRMFEFPMAKDEVIELRKPLHQTIKKVTEDYEKLAFNTAISQMMIFVNEVYKVQTIGKKQARDFLKLLNPICPHLTEELNQTVLSIHEELIYSEWPIHHEPYLVETEIEMVVQVNGKLRAKFMVDAKEEESTLKTMVLNHPNVEKHIEGLTIRKIIVIPGKLINIVAS